MDNVFFIIGCPRSATTAIAEILQISNNSEIYIEQEPKLCIESRRLWKDQLDNPTELLHQHKENIIKSVTDRGLVYGDKNPNYLPFVPYLEQLWNPKFIFVLRDGRDVVRSLLDWHHVCGGNVFGMIEDDENSTVELPEEDWWDYSRLRPNCTDKYFNEWKNMGRFEKCAWYWNEFTLQMFSLMASLSQERYRLIHVEKVCASDFEEIFNFLNLNHFNAKKIEKKLASRINAADGRAKVIRAFPQWDSWTDEYNQQFDRLARSAMELSGYY
ncbi:sulfotransferase [Candidatus Omnitrophota bacterium]